MAIVSVEHEFAGIRSYEEIVDEFASLGQEKLFFFCKV